MQTTGTGFQDLYISYNLIEKSDLSQTGVIISLYTNISTRCFI